MVSLAGVEAVLLDMDGTLVDSDAAVERAWRAWSAEYGMVGADVFRRAHGQPALTTVRQLHPEWSEVLVQQAAARQHALEYEDLTDVVAAPGAAELLATLARLELPWCVVTSADRKLAGLRLAAAGIEPPYLITFEDVRRGKPDPEGYQLAAATLRVAPRRCLVVEDSMPGLIAGRRAGAITASLRGLPADLPLSDLGQLAALLGGARRQPPAHSTLERGRS